MLCSTANDAWQWGGGRVPRLSVGIQLVIPSHRRDPGAFCGMDGIGVKGWLNTSEPVSSDGSWEAMLKGQTQSCLKGAVRGWFDTHVQPGNSQCKLGNLFRKKELASNAQTLPNRIGRTYEVCLLYVQRSTRTCPRQTRWNMPWRHCWWFFHSTMSSFLTLRLMGQLTGICNVYYNTWLYTETAVQCTRKKH